MTRQLILDNSRVSLFKSRTQIEKWYVQEGEGEWFVVCDAKYPHTDFTRTTYAREAFDELPIEVLAAIKQMQVNRVVGQYAARANINGHRAG